MNTGPCANAAGRAVCDAATLLSCDAAGVPTGAPLACESAMYCELGLAAGACAICNPGSFKCEGRTLSLCKPEGQYMQLDTCASEALCKEAAGACTEMVCTPNDKVCGADGSLLTCNADGSELMPGMRCENGCDAMNSKCFDCLPGAKQCQDGTSNLLTCSAEGVPSSAACSGETPRCVGDKCVACIASNDCPQTDDCVPTICDGANRCVPDRPRQAGTRCGNNGICDDRGECTQCGNGVIDAEENCDPAHPAWMNDSERRCDPSACLVTELVYATRSQCAQPNPPPGNACWPGAGWACALGGLQCVTPCTAGNDAPCRTTTERGSCETVYLDMQPYTGCFITCRDDNNLDCPRGMVCTSVPGDSVSFCALQEWPMPPSPMP
ncbi:MAG: hypothetical protein ABW321_32615 [Polyangiales bacterium]